MDKIRILQLGERDWKEAFRLPGQVQMDHVDFFTEQPEQPYDLVFLDRTPRDEEIGPLHEAVKAYTLFVTERVKLQGQTEWLCRCKKAQYIADERISDFLLQETRYYYAKPYGEKAGPGDLAVSRDFCGRVGWDGSRRLVLEGEFGEKFCQAAYWRYNSFIAGGQVLDLWLEYQKSPEVGIALSVTQFARGSREILGQWRFDEAELEQVVRLESRCGDGWLFFSVEAKGRGSLKLTGLHKRLSRGSHGHFLPGGRRQVSSAGEEAFSYFDPGDLRPPLNVYFSGYKTLEGFEGYYMMRGLGCPFLLLSEPRLTGGNFYLGSGEYESLFAGVIRECMEELGFTEEQVILSGLSMGTFGALYYGCELKPRALILGKPLANIGTVAAHEKRLRPGGFPTSLDVLRYHCGSLEEEAVKRLDARFWDRFDRTDWGNTKFIVSYMLEDDYDAEAYGMLLSHVRSGGAQVYGKGIHGRHNDNTPAIVNWFVSQYQKILREDFSRKTGQK